MKQSGRKWLVLLIAVLVALAVLTLTACGFGTPTGDDKDPDGTGGSQKEEIDDLKSDRVSYDIATVEASGYSHIAGPNTDGQKDTYQSDEYISLPQWRGGGQGTNGWLTPTQGDSDNPARLPAQPRNTTGVGTSFTMVKGDYTYYFEFVGWYLDTELKYEVRPEDTFQYDVKLYPGYKINKVRNR